MILNSNIWTLFIFIFGSSDSIVTK